MATWRSFLTAALAAAIGAASGAVAAQTTIDFRALGTFDTFSLTRDGVTLTGESAPGVTAQLRVLNFNGIGVYGGTSENVIDTGEAVLLRFVDGQATGVSVFRAFLGDDNGNSAFGDTTIEGFFGSTSLGSFNGSSFTVNVSTLFGGQPLTGFTLRGVDRSRLSSMTFTLGVVERHWINTQSGSWSTAANWSPNGVPGALSTVFIDPSGGVRVTGPSGNTTVDLLTIGARDSGVAVLALGGDLQVNRSATVQSRGAIELAGAAVLRAPLLSNEGVVRGGGQVDAPLGNTAAGRVIVGPGQRLEFSAAELNRNAGVIEANGGEVSFSGALQNVAGSGLITARDAILRFNGGLQNIGSLALTAGFSDVHGDIANTGTIALGARAQAIFHGDVQQNGSFIIPAQASATTLGEFTGGGFTGGGELVILGDLRPGFSPAVTLFGGDLTLGPGADTEIELEGLVPGQFDQVIVDGRLTLGGTLAVPVGGGFSLALGQSFTIFTAGNGVFGEFVGLADGALVGLYGGNELFIDYGPNSVTLLTGPIPEPSTYTLLSAGLALIAFAARRRSALRSGRTGDRERH